MKQTIQIAALALGLLLVGQAEAKTIRATELTSSVWSKLAAGTSEDVTVEFRQGDEIPVTLAAQGDFLVSTQVSTSIVLVKKNFWLQLQNNDLQVSLDGTTFKPMKDVVSGSFTASGWSGSGPVNAINLALEAYLK